MLQHGAYTLLIDACYDRERFPTKEEAIDWTWASSEEEINAVEFVLKKFFSLGEDGVYQQERINEELEKYHANAKTNKRIAQERETKRKENSTKRARSVDGTPPKDNEAPPNHKPLTKNHKPLTNKPEDQKTSSDKPDGAINRFDDFWQMYPRKTDKKKAQTAWSRLKPTDDLAIKIITNVSNRLASGEWVKGSQYIPHPTTYLNGSRWDDEAQAPDDNRTSREKRNEAIAADSKAKFDAGDLYDPFERIMSGNNDPSIINNDDLLEHQP